MMASAVCKSKAAATAMRDPPSALSTAMCALSSSLTVSTKDVAPFHVQTACKDDTFEMLHLCFGLAVPVKVVKQHFFDELLPHVTCPTTGCDSFHIRKLCLRFDGALTNLNRTGNIHMDSKYSLDFESVRSHNFFVMTVTEGSRLFVIRQLKSKSDLGDVILQIVKYLRNNEAIRYVVFTWKEKLSSIEH